MIKCQEEGIVIWSGVIWSEIYECEKGQTKKLRLGLTLKGQMYNLTRELGTFFLRKGALVFEQNDKHNILVICMRKFSY